MSGQPGPLLDMTTRAALSQREGHLRRTMHSGPQRRRRPHSHTLSSQHLLLHAFLLLLLLSSHLVSPSPIYDCGVDVQQLPACTWTAAELRSHLTHLLSSSPPAAPSSPALLAFIDRLVDEDVDGNVFLSLEPDEVDFLTHKDSPHPPPSLQPAILHLMRSLITAAPPSSSSPSTPSLPSAPSSPASTPPDDDPSLCAPLLASVPPHEREVLDMLTDEVRSIRATLTRPTSPPSNYTGRWPSSALKRWLPSLFHPTPRSVLVLLGDFDVDLSFVLYHLQPHALLLHISDNRRTDPLPQLREKLSKRRGTSKRGKTANVHLNLDPTAAICVLRGWGIEPDVVHVSPHILPLSSACCRWWEGPAVVLGHAPGYANLHSLALLTGRRIFVDQPLWVLSKPHSEVRCLDDVGHLIDRSAPLVGLYMIVKNEAGGMEDTMHSILPHIDGLSVLDTGSDDGTDALIERMMGETNVPGAVHHGSFIDFSTTRNEALRLASSTLNTTTFLLMLNGDDTFVGGDDLRRFLGERVHLCGPSEEMYLLCVDYDGHKIAWSERVMRTSNHRHADWPSTQWWHYIGLTHESYTHIPYASGELGDFAMTYAGRPAGGVDDGFRFHIHHTYVRDHKEKLHARAQKDAQLLLRQLEIMPDDPRTLYYLSHSYDIQDKYAEAYTWHQRRVRKVVDRHLADPSAAIEADKEECTCLLRLGKISAYRLPEEHGWEEAERWLELTRALCPEQIETRFYLAEHFYIEGDAARAWTYAREAEELRKTGRGMMHVLESETVNHRLPQLVELVKTAMRGQTLVGGEGARGDSAGAEGGSAKGKTTKKRKKAAGKASKKDEL